MKVVGKVFLTILEFILIFYVILITTFLLCRNKYGYTEIFGKTLISVNDDNGAELGDFSSGDLLVIKQVKFGNVNIDDELYFYDAVNNKYVIRKGNVKEKTGDSYSAAYIIEDNSISKERIIGKLDKKYSTLGAILSILESRIGFLLAVILPIFVLFIYQVYKMVILIKLEPNLKK